MIDAELLVDTLDDLRLINHASVKESLSRGTTYAGYTFRYVR